MASTAPPGHRRVSSLKTTTLSFLKGNRSPDSSVDGRRKRLNISSPLPLTREDTDAAFPGSADTEAQFRQGTSIRSFEAIGSTVSAVDTTSSIVGLRTPEMDAADQPEPPRISVDDGNSTNESHNSTRTKKSATKFRMALNLLKRRSNPNLRKSYGDSGQERTISRISEPYNAPFLNPATISSARPIRSNGREFRSGFDRVSSTGRTGDLELSHRPQRILTNMPSDEIRRQRRATVASVVMDSIPVNSMPTWPEVDSRPWSSVSVTPPDASPVEDTSNASLFSRESTLLSGQPASGGGLFPRPVSMQRNWSDGPRNHRGSGSTLKGNDRGPFLGSPLKSAVSVSTARQRRPSSFSGVPGGYTNMKITEAASMETRVRDLEDQVAVLQKLLRRTSGSSTDIARSPISDIPEQHLQSPFDEQKLPSRRYTVTSVHSYDHSTQGTYPATAKQGESPEMLRKRERALRALEGVSTDTGNKRSTTSTIRELDSEDKVIAESGVGRVTSTQPAVSLAEYAGLMAVVKREQRARRKLEVQVAQLQEQMATVLHRHLLASQPPASTASAVSLQKTRSREVMTPEQTPPRFHSGIRPANIFPGFDSDQDVPPDQTDDDGSSTDEAADERWESFTPEQQLSVPHARTMSLSKVTEKSLR